MTRHDTWFTFFHDAGHGWLACPVELARELSLTPSSYSYRDSVYLYLEENSDAGTFIDAYRSAFGVEPEVRERSLGARAFIRDLPRC